MDKQRCYRILELEPGASRREARRAYTDLVLVWHPSRFIGNPRLKKKAEIKLKEITTAYEEVRLLLGPDQDIGQERRPGIEGKQSSRWRGPEREIDPAAGRCADIDSDGKNSFREVLEETASARREKNRRR